MKNLLFLLLLVLSTLSCKQATPPTYQEGLDRCSEIVKKKQQEHPGAITLSFPDCIVGSTLPEFKGQTMDGQIIDYHYFTGKISIINFWFETCAPCVA